MSTTTASEATVVTSNQAKNPRRWRWLAGLVAVLLTAGAGLGVVFAVVSGGSGAAHADALCDQMRLEHGPHWPCINVPTYTPQPTQNTPPPTGTSPGAPGNGPNAGGSPGPGPGTGNGTPIIPVPGQQPPQQKGQRPAPPNTGQPAPPQSARPAPQPPTPPQGQQPAPPTPVTVPGPALSPAAPATESGSIPLAVWLLVGAAALVAGGRSAGLPGKATSDQSGAGRTLKDVLASLSARFKHNAGGYILKFKGGSGRLGGPDTRDMKPRDVSALLRECFNCYFPIEGAPKKFPKAGDEMPLVIDVAGVSQKAPVRVTEIVDTEDDFSFELLALPGHFDGAGSTIRFHFWNDGHLRLDVIATTTSRTAPPGWLNYHVGELVWKQFFANVVQGLHRRK